MSCDVSSRDFTVLFFFFLKPIYLTLKCLDVLCFVLFFPFECELVRPHAGGRQLCEFRENLCPLVQVIYGCFFWLNDYEDTLKSSVKGRKNQEFCKKYIWICSQSEIWTHPMNWMSSLLFEILLTLQFLRETRKTMYEHTWNHFRDIKSVK